MPGVPTAGAVFGQTRHIATWTPVVTVVDSAHHPALVHVVVFILASLDLVVVSTIEEPVAEVSSTTVAEPVGVVGWSTVRDTASRFGIRVAECMRLLLHSISIMTIF